jgi:chemotaxis protein MotB
MDAKKVQEAVGSLAGALSVLEGGTKTEISKQNIQQATPMETQDETTNMVKTIKSMIAEISEVTKTQGAPNVTVEEAEDGFLIQLPASLLFKPGSAKIHNEDAFLFLRRISSVVAKLPKTLDLDVRGHTDDRNPAENSPYKDNWELSSARAVTVAKTLIEYGLNPKKVMATGRSEYDPIASNQTEEGRAKNRRVALHFYSTDEKDKKEAQGILDQMKKAQ